MKADDLVESAGAAMNSGNLPVAIALLKRATDIDPKNKFAWNNLGRAYFAMHEDEQAIAAFRKQIDVNPYDEFAYNNLGRVYWNERKYDDAVKAFNKQLESNPLDKFSHANLGAMYAEWHKYDLAVPELEKAASLTPDNPDLQVSLGDAYLNLGQDDKALAAFDHAVELAATPLVWNNIAYQLSLKKSHLDRAQQYAESSVSATAAALRNVSLDRLTQQELPLVSSLIAYWDTLGWIHFVEGDLSKAEKYVGAAWGLGHHGEVGDHLGQIYEKQGAKDRALRTYALSMNGIRPIPETRTRLASLIGGDAKADAAIARSKDDLEHLSTVDLGKATQTGNADFFILLSGGAGATAKVDAVKFVSGDEKLKSYTEALRTADYHVTFPDDTPVKVFRRGTLSCAVTTGKCQFVLTLPDDVRTVD
jgi:tetratricopeptide (TPR) repeat protein